MAEEPVTLPCQAAQGFMRDPSDAPDRRHCALWRGLGLPVKSMSVSPGDCWQSFLALPQGAKLEKLGADWAEGSECGAPRDRPGSEQGASQFTARPEDAADDLEQSYRPDEAAEPANHERMVTHRSTSPVGEWPTWNLRARLRCVASPAS